MNLLNISTLSFDTIRGFNHWIFQRISALSFLSIVIIVYFTDSIIFGGLGILFIIFHINAGLETLMIDYMHDYIAKIYNEAVLDILIICLVKSFFLFFLYV